MAADVAFRGLIAYRADEPYVRDLIVRGRLGDPSVDEVLGTAVTDPEAAELRERLQLQREIIRVVGYGQDYPNSYAGIYIDQKNGGVATALFTNDLELHRNNLRSFPMPERLRVVTARWTLDQLQSGLESIRTQLRTLELRGIRVISIAVSIEGNTVRVGLRELSAYAHQYFEEHYPAGLVELFQPRYSIQATAAIAGGTRLVNLDRNIGCTAGFSFRNSTGDYGFFTAGHCARNQGERFGAPGYGQNYYRTFGSIFGVAPGTRVYPDENTDSTVIPAPAADTTNASGWVIINRAAGFHDDQWESSCAPTGQARVHRGVEQSLSRANSCPMSLAHSGGVTAILGTLDVSITVA